jgi:hypothetical protein
MTDEQIVARVRELLASEDASCTQVRYILAEIKKAVG